PAVAFAADGATLRVAAHATRAFVAAGGDLGRAFARAAPDAFVAGSASSARVALPIERRGAFEKALAEAMR
ncbi:MAG: hypothetical protein ACYDCK_15555, partial [Thermoplasmatota archaeon]